MESASGDDATPCPWYDDVVISPATLYCRWSTNDGGDAAARVIRSGFAVKATQQREESHNNAIRLGRTISCLFLRGNLFPSH